MHRSVPAWACNTGRQCSGDTGGRRRFEFAGIGDTVNVVSRLESLTRSLNEYIVAGGDLTTEVRCGCDSELLIEGFRERSSQENPGYSGVITLWVTGRRA